MDKLRLLARTGAALRMPNVRRLDRMLSELRIDRYRLYFTIRDGRAVSFLQTNPDVRALYDELTPRTEWVATVINARAERGWTQTDLARAIGVQQPAIAKIESGDRDPKLSTMVAVCRALGIEELRLAIPPLSA